VLTQTEPPHTQHLGDGLTLRTAASERDVERVAEFNGSIHGPGVVAMTRNLLLQHPHTAGRGLIFVEDETTRQVVSSLFLIPWVLRYEDVKLPSGEQGIVGTAPAYRQRGLIRAQNAYFKQRLRERGCLLSHIQGIPYYYRQFGYEYALPLEGGLRLEKRSIPAPQETRFTFRQATLDDLPILAQLYDEASRDLAIRAERSESIWRYLFTCTQGSEMECENWLIEDRNQHIVGYMRVPKHHFGKELVVNEVSRLSFDAALAALNHLKTLAETRNQPAIRLNLPANCSLMQVARSLGAHDMGTYAWQIHVPDMAALLQAIGPVLERRVAGSPFAGLTRQVRLCFYRETVALHFEAGQLDQVANLGLTDAGPINVPPLQFIPLLLGYRSIDELRAAYPDVRVAPDWRLLIETLFPRTPSFLYTIY